MRWLAAAAVAGAVGLGACHTLRPPQQWDTAHGVVVPHDTFPADCSLCHISTGWHAIKPDFHYDHAAETGVALEGAHAGAQCLRCHNDRGPVTTFVAKGCSGCHGDPHRNELGRDCTSCHDQQTWHPTAAIDLHRRTRFPLVGAHAYVSCVRCHRGARNGIFTGLDTACVGCHLAKYDQTTAPKHSLPDFPTTCERCHSTYRWPDASFSHPWFPINSGKHKGLNCSACHASLATPTQFECINCHKHRKSEMDGTHSSVSGYAYNSAACYSCHPNGTK